MGTEPAAGRKAGASVKALSRNLFPLAVEAAALSAVSGLVLWGERSAPPPSEPAVGGVWFLWYFLSAFAAATVLMILLLRSRRGSRWFAAFFSLAVFIGVGIITERLWGAGAAILVTASAVLLHYGLRRVAIFDLVLASGLAGITLSLGEALQPLTILVILVVLSFYDLFAVFVTGHMVQAAEALLERRAFFAIIVPAAPRWFWTDLAAVAPGSRFLFLGTGDLVLPALLVAATGRSGTAAALTVLAGALAGLTAMHFIFTNQTRRRPIPALPPIALGAILGYLVSFLASS